MFFFVFFVCFCLHFKNKNYEMKYKLEARKLYSKSNLYNLKFCNTSDTILQKTISICLKGYT